MNASQAAPCDPLLDGIPYPSSPTPILHVHHLKLDPEVETVDALEDFLRKFDAARELTAQLGLTVEEIDELAQRAADLICGRALLQDRSHAVHAILLRLLRSGLRTDAIGRLVGVSRGEVVNRLCRKNYGPADLQGRFAVEDMSHAGVHKGDIAEATGLQYESVASYQRLLGLYKAERARPGHERALKPGRDRALQLMSDGLTNLQIVNTLKAEGIAPCPNRKLIGTWRTRFYTRTHTEAS